MQTQPACCLISALIMFAFFFFFFYLSTQVTHSGVAFIEAMLLMCQVGKKINLGLFLPLSVTVCVSVNSARSVGFGSPWHCVATPRWEGEPEDPERESKLLWSPLSLWPHHGCSDSLRVWGSFREAARWLFHKVLACRLRAAHVGLERTVCYF